MTRELHEAIRQHWRDFDTIREMARQTGIPQSTISEWKNAELGERAYRETTNDRDRLRALQNCVDIATNDAVESEADDADPYAGACPPEPSLKPRITGSTSAPDVDVDRVRQEAERRFREKHRRAQTKKQQTVRFPGGPVCLFFLGDQHIGNAGTDIARMYRERDLIMRTPCAYAWMMGDVVDNFIVGRLMAQNMKPSTPVWEQWALAKNYLGSFEDRIIANVGGNHGAWSMMLTGLDYRRDVCPEGVLYDGDEIQATVSVGSYQYKVWARHQWRGSSIYNPTHGQERAARFASARHDLYVGAHTHKGAMYREFILGGERKASIQTGAYKVHDDYARRLGFPGNDASTACGVILHDDGARFGAADLQALHRYMRAVYGRAA